jgi:haloalkane dehalogenase
MIQRAFVAVGGRLVHFRHAGSGAPVLLVHQSPKSSAEFEALIEKWSTTNLVIAPDTPGFGDSCPLPAENVDCTDFAEALIALLDALGIARIATYGVHSGAVFAVAAATLAPEKFTAVVCNGYAVWTPDEITAFGARYLPPFLPTSYGDHLTWLWARMREQRFFFPWYEANDSHRMSLPAATAAHLHAGAMDMLAAGDSYRAGYGAVVRANRDLPPDGISIPTLIVSFDGDPLKAHLKRLGQLPHNWRVATCVTQAQTESAAKAFLDMHPAPSINFFVPAGTSRQFVGDIHVALRGNGQTLLLHAPGSSGMAMLDAYCGTDALALDLPGHGLTSRKYISLEQVMQAIVATLDTLHVRPKEIVAENLAMPLAMMLATVLTPEPALQIIGYRRYGADEITQLEKYYLTDTSPDLQGAYLLHAWRRVRDSCFFDPWFDNDPAAIKPVDDAALAPAKLATAHLAAVQATGGPAMLHDILRIFEKENQNEYS